MNAVEDFEDLLTLLGEQNVRYLIIGGLAFIYHAKPRYTKDMDIWVDFTTENVERAIWVDFTTENVERANRALAAFGSPTSLSDERDDEVLQLGFAPNRIDFFLRIEGVVFEEAWRKRIRGSYGTADANWIDLDTLLKIKSGINKPKHQEDARILREVKRLKNTDR